MTHPGLVDGPIYLDYNATTPVDPRAVEAALPYLTNHFGNPSSGHAYARAPRAAIDQARHKVADLLGAMPNEIVFTGGGSEADTLAIRGAALAAGRGGHVITQVTEHPAVLEASRSLQDDGFNVTRLPVDLYGMVDPAVLEAAMTGRTVLVSIMAANSETGTLQPLAELAAIAHSHSAVFHTDAAQAAGKINLDLSKLDIDLLTLVGHKMYAPKGVGALYVKAGTALQSMIRGGGQERGLRAGTENVALIVALGAAAQIAAEELGRSTRRLAELRDLLQSELARALPGRTRLNGHPIHRLPGTLNLSLTGANGRDLLAATPQIAASTGSACHEGGTTPSPVLTAMGLPDERTRSAIRFSLGRWSTADEIERAARHLADQYTRLETAGR
jgi:cysteine desulfurase